MKNLLITLSTLPLLLRALVGSAAAQQECGTPPVLSSSSELSESTKKELTGQADLLSKWVGKAELGGKVETAKKEIYQTSDSFFAARKEAYLDYLFCVLIMSDKFMPLGDKLNALNTYKNAEPIRKPGQSEKNLGPQQRGHNELPQETPLKSEDISQQVRWGGTHLARLRRCSVVETLITCEFVIKNLESGANHDYHVRTIIGGHPKLIDNFQAEHQPVRSYFVNGRGQHQDKLNFAPNESARFVIEFENGPKDITSGRIISNGAQFIWFPE